MMQLEEENENVQVFSTNFPTERRFVTNWDEENIFQRQCVLNATDVFYGKVITISIVNMKNTILFMNIDNSSRRLSHLIGCS